MNFEKELKLMTSAQVIEIAQQAATELERRNLTIPERLGKVASSKAIYKSKDLYDLNTRMKPLEELPECNDTSYEPTFPAQETGSNEAVLRARERGSSGMPRWMEPFSPVDMFGEPTVFSDQFSAARRFRRD